MIELCERAVPYIIAFGGALLLTLVLVPPVRELNRRLGMVDKPDARRINKVAVPRGGGVALVAGVLVSYALFIWLSGRPPLQGNGVTETMFWRMSALSVVLALLGLCDDKFNLPPKVKLAGQLAVSVAAWAWAGFGFCRLWPALPGWADCLLTVFWIVGAVNAFNLIDGLDGLASGLALVATLGMSGTLFLVGNPQQTLFYFAFAGGLIGFLRYNYNPASVFLGDCGSMFIGFILATLPLASQEPNSFVVSVVVPMLAMGVPIFDTALAILRRSVRHLISRRGNPSGAGASAVMTADADHLHHRIFRAVGLNQRKAAWVLYALSAALVAVGMIGVSLRSRAAGLWLLAFTVAVIVVFKDLSRIEFFDAGRLLESIAHDRATSVRRRWARLSVPFYLVFDITALVMIFFLCAWVMRHHVGRAELRIAMPLRVASVFFFLTVFNTYRTVWARAMVSNYVRLMVACVLGAVAGSVGCYYAGLLPAFDLEAVTLLYALGAFFLLTAVRLLRGIVRDAFYALDCSRLKSGEGVSRVLVYGSGLRYRAFRRELVRTTSANDRMIVGIIDDDLLLRGQFIGGIQILGTLIQAPDIIRRLQVDSVVVTCKLTSERQKVVRKILAPTGVKITIFSFSETEFQS